MSKTFHMISDIPKIHFDERKKTDMYDSRIFKNMKYARIIELIAEKQHISLEEAMDMLYSSPLFDIIDDGTADLICRSDIYLADEIIRTNKRH